MSDGLVNKVTGGLTRVDHEPIGKLHRFGTRGAELAGNDDLAALCAGLHDEAEDTVRRTVVTTKEIAGSRQLRDRSANRE